MKPLNVYSPAELESDRPPDLSSARYRFLAEGDSWFTISGLSPFTNSNLLFEMAFGEQAYAVSCALPGDTLARMANMNRDPTFAQLLAGKRSQAWDGLLLSCGGNDLIDALQTPDPSAPRAQRLLLAPADWGPASDGPARYLSPEGWQTFETYLLANLDHILALRDAGPAAGRPAFLHGYACPMPRPSGAGALSGPWLLPALQDQGIPPDDWSALATLLIRKLGASLARAAADTARFPNLHFFDTSAIAIDAADGKATGRSGDWLNEIHLTRGGYRKLARPWAAAIEQTVNGG